MKKVLLTVTSITAGVLLVVFLLLYSKQDRTAPVITFSENLSYVSGEDQESLLKGVIAKDDRDGDVTDSLCIEQIFEDEDSVYVTYVARDQANNIKKLRCQIPMKEAPVNEVPGETEEEKDTETETQERMTEEETESSEEGTEPVPEVQVPPEAPVITLKQDTLVIPAGQAVNLLSYVSTITDDVDDKNFLWGRIEIDGDVFQNTVPGSYDIIYSVTDREGHRSNKAHLIVTVQ